MTTAWPHGAPEVGQRAQRSRLITERYIELFTEISGDRNPVHYDEEVATHRWLSRSRGSSPTRPP